MSDKGKDASSTESQRATQGEQLAKAVKWIIQDKIFAEIKLHGNIDWLVVHLVQTAILWVWSSQRKLVDSADEAIADARKLFGAVNVNSYQTLLNGLKKYSPEILCRLSKRIHQLMEKTDRVNFRIGLWLVLAVDGSRISTCRTLPNERRFCKSPSATKKKKKRKNKRGRTAKKRKPVSKKKNYNPQPVGPQVWLTLLWHVGQRLPWAWKIGPSYSSERNHLREMIKAMELPENTLICGDAGFVGYDFWQTITEQGHHFLVRVGGNCTLLKQLGRVREKDGIVYCWPEAKQRRNEPPLVLRLIRLHDGRGEIYLVTSELNQRKLSDRQASKIYRRRWGIEVQFRSLKQTYGRSKLLGRTPDVVEQELSWSLIGLWMIQLLALREQVDEIEPEGKTSVAMVLRIVRNILRRPDEKPARGDSLKNLLSQATIDTYDRQSQKKSRNFPRRKEEPRTGPPKIKLATTEQKKLDKAIRSLSNAA
jgi:hypothetical protein